MKKIIVIWDDSNSISTSDPYVDKRIRDLIIRFNAVDYSIKTFVASELIILGLRVQVKLGKIKPEELLFVYGSKEIKVDKHGELSEYPDGFCDRYNKYLLELV